MRLLLKIAVFAIGFVAATTGAFAVWLVSYSKDLPDLKSLSQFAPSSASTVNDPCFRLVVTVIPYDAIGANLKMALGAAEASENDPHVLSDTYHSFRGDRQLRRPTVSEHISRTMFCTPSKQLHRHLAEFRTAIQLERHFSRSELFTIYANRVYLGPGLIGIQQGADFYFHKAPTDLNFSEAALLAGVIRAPSFYSPTNHADRALQRRNEVLDAMAGNGSIRAFEAQSAKTIPLQLAGRE